MRLLDHLISRRTAMPDQPDDITRLRTAHYALEDLPETIAFPQRPGRRAARAAAGRGGDRRRDRLRDRRGGAGELGSLPPRRRAPAPLQARPRGGVHRRRPRRRGRAEEGGPVMALPIIGADERLAQRKGIKGVIFGRSGIGKTSPALDAERLDDALPRSRGRRSGGRGAGDRHAPAPHLEGMPRFRGVHRRAEPGAARGPALQPGAFRRGLRSLRRSGGDREVRDRLHRLDHRGRAALLPVVPRPARGRRRRRPASPTSAAPTGCMAAR